MAFDYGDEVRVTTAERTPEQVGKIGVIVGIGEDEGRGASYAVRLRDDDAIVSFWESELTARP
ncbi:MAG: hypothetical protein CVT62_09805 [Actinobacteria bacterium HGW-Actinobacteria-2]|nr:MAG: hypothetical protein CVT62_09805 [Actinobacteria bacterium HGW-Actinobacteria-2]